MLVIHKRFEKRPQWHGPLFHSFVLSLFTTLYTTTFAQPTLYRDVPYLQDYSVKYYTPDSTIQLPSAYADRNGVIQILSSSGLLRPRSGQFQYPGTLEADRSYRPTTDRKIAAVTMHEQQFVYLDDTAIFSNAWAGKLFVKHTLPGANLFCGGSAFTFLVSDGTRLKLLSESVAVWEGPLAQDQVNDIRYEAAKNRFWILGSHSLSVLNVATKKLTAVFQTPNLTCFDIAQNTVYLGTHDGYLTLDATTYKPIGSLQKKLPCPNLTTIRVVQGNLWFGSSLARLCYEKTASSTITTANAGYPAIR